MAEPTIPTPIRHIDRFQIRRVLGRGGQGIVFLAFDPQLEREVAIKTLGQRTAVRASPDDLLKEARLAARLQHPNIVRVFDCGTSAGLPYVVFEYVEGLALKEILSAEGARAPGRAMEIVGSLLEAIHYAHEHGVVHRDLKPANILIDAQGVPRIADFGIAGLLGQIAAGEKTGSAGYMAPEQLESRPLRRELDIFAIGVILYQLVAGRLPIEADNPFAQLYQMAHEEIPPPSRFRPELDAAVDTIVLKALEKEPGRRYADATEFLDALRLYRSRGREEGDVYAATGSSGTLDFLLRRMRHKPDFPAMSQHVAEINRMSADGSDWSANALANLVLNDYSLTTKLLRLVNSPLFGQYGREISTISRAIVILGFKQVRLAALSLLLFEHLQGGEGADELRDAAVGALMSGLMAHRLAGTLRLEEPEEAYVCAMFHGLGRHLVIYYFPEEYRVIHDRMAQRGESELAASIAVLGVSYADIGVGVARSWGFPPALSASMAPLPAGKLPRAGSREAKLHQLAGISNALCRTFATLEGKARDRALAEIRDRFGATISLDDKALLNLVEAALEEIREHADLLRLPTGGSPLLKQIRGWRSEQVGETGATGDVAEGSSAAAVQDTAEDGTSTLMAGVQEVTNAMLEECPLNELLTMVLEVIYRGLQPTRVLFWVRDPKRREMVTRFGFGKNIDQLLGQLRFALGEGQDLFNCTLRQGSDEAVADTQDPAVASRIPEWCRGRLSARTLALYPLMVKQSPLGLILIDWEAPRRLPSPAIERLLKTLRNQAVLAVRQQGAR